MFKPADFTHGQFVRLTTVFANEGLISGVVVDRDWGHNTITIIQDEGNSFDKLTIKCKYIETASV